MDRRLLTEQNDLIMIIACCGVALVCSVKIDKVCGIS